ncbi:M48 family metalloprotease, partial [Conexibacter sp. CPCC 205762]
MPDRRSAWRIEALLALLGTIATVAAALAAAVALLPGDDAADAIDHAHEPLLVHILLEWPLVAISALLALAVALRGGAALLRHLRARRRIAPALAAAVPSQLDGVTVRVIDDPRPLAFCAGLWRPRIHVSSGAVAALGGGALVADGGAAGAIGGAAGAIGGSAGAIGGSAGAIGGSAGAIGGSAGAIGGSAGAGRGADPQLRALIAHEAAHARRRDGLRQLAGELAAQSLFFLPALRPLGARRATEAELNADAAAVEACGGDARPLARALLAFEAAGDGPLAVDPARIDALTGPAFVGDAGAGGAGAGVGGAGAGAGGAG